MIQFDKEAVMVRDKQDPNRTPEKDIKRLVRVLMHPGRTDNSIKPAWGRLCQLVNGDPWGYLKKEFPDKLATIRRNLRAAGITEN